MSRVMDVIVVGCGAAGVAALRRLHDSGLNVMGLEAADRIGGRIYTVPFGNGNVDIGAAWCHGEKDNIVFELANPHNLLGRPKPDHKWFVLSNGDLLPATTGESILQALGDALSKADKNNAKSISECIRRAAESDASLRKYQQLTSSFVEWFERNNHVGGQTDPRTGKSLKGLEESWACDGEVMLNWKGRGYKTILDVLLNKDLNPELNDPLPIEILKNKEVESIKWKTKQAGLSPTNPLVQIKCKDGSLFAAKCVVVTVSIGVLKERHHQLFDPPLPAEKINAIENLQLCVLDKIYIEFTEPWWPKTPASFTELWLENDKKKFTENESWITEIYGFNTVEYQPNLLLAWIYGNGAKEMEKASLEEVKAGVTKLLDILFRKDFAVTPVKSILRSNWASNPLARGAYGYRSVANEEDGGDAITLSTPLFYEYYDSSNTNSKFPIVCFAGEATSHHRHSAVHGAIESGFREGDRLVESFQREANLK